MIILRNLTLTAVSSNTKVGRIPTTSRPIDLSCPDECIFKHQGCYGETRIDGVTRRYARDIPMAEAVEILDRRRKDAPFGRDRVVGGITLPDGGIDWEYLEAISELGATVGLPWLSYAQEWPRIDPAAVERLPGRYVLNASTQTREDAAEAIGRGWPTTIASDSVGSRERIAGRRTIICPAVTRGITCEACGLCARPERPTVVVFPLHGSTVGKARAAVAERERMVER